MPNAPLQRRSTAAATSSTGKAETAVVLLRSHTLVSICQSEIERMILDAGLEMGARINELALASRLGISRGPVREACRSLVQAGLLESQVNRGFFVRRLTLKEVGDLYDLRAGLMRMAGELLAHRITKARIDRLRELVTEMDAATISDDAARFRDLNAEFHALLIEAAENRRLQDVCQGLAKEIQLYRRLALVSRDAMERSNREHHAIVDAVARRDPIRTAAVMGRHILQGKVRFLRAAGSRAEPGRSRREAEGDSERRARSAG